MDDALRGVRVEGGVAHTGLTEEQVKRVVSRWRKQPAAAVRSVDDGSDDDDDGAQDWE